VRGRSAPRVWHDAGMASDTTDSPPVPAPERLLALAVRVAAGGAALARDAREAAITRIRTKSTRTDVVTEADHAVERYVIAGLRAERPDDGVLTEESGAHPGAAGSRVRWILDPIDGTVNYLYGIPHYGVSLAAEVDGEVVAGVVHNAATGASWTAVRGRGAHRDGRRLSGSGADDLGRALVATGFGYLPRRRTHQARVLAGLIAGVGDIRRFGAAAFDLCLAAEGAVDAFYEKGLNYWDFAAGALIATEAGLRVSGIDGGPPDPGFLLAAPPAIHEELRVTLAALDAAGGP
jgi:myo-inositol-1(or 4)-monophosphatase